MADRLVPSVLLRNGASMPILGFGLYQVEPERTEEIATSALEVGYRHFDTAAAYYNEAALGRAVATSGLRREDLFITTKLRIQEPGEANARIAFEQSLLRLGLEYVDLYLIHLPYGDYYSSWRELQRLHEEGLARAIGVSNFHPDRLIDLIDHNEISPHVNQIEVNPFFQREADHELMIEHGVQMESWGGFAQGRNGLFINPNLRAIAEVHGRSVAQIVLRWLIQRDVVAIPKTVRQNRMIENIEIFDFELTDDEMGSIKSLDTGASQFFDHRDPSMVAWINSRKQVHS